MRDDLRVPEISRIKTPTPLLIERPSGRAALWLETVSLLESLTPEI
jgi:hypothetical protein